MDSQWMGRYRPLIAELVRHGNISVKLVKSKASPACEDVSMPHVEWQVLEAVIERSEENANMNQICRAVGIPQSTFSKAAAFLCRRGLAEKYQVEGNRKNVILKPTEAGIKLYRERSAVIQNSHFSGFFQELEGVSDEAILAMTRAVANLNDRIDPASEEPSPRLIKKP